jgi:hypothetical protein
MAGGLAALVGLAGAANAADTMSLIWQSTGSNTLNCDSACAGSPAFVLDVIINADSDGSLGGEMSVDYTNVGLDPNKLAVLGYSINPDGDFNGIDLTPTVDNGQALTGIGELIAVGGATCVSASCRLATITFQKNSGDNTNITLQSFYSPGEGVDFIPPTVACAPGTCGAAFGTAQILNVPEPGALALLGLGFGGLVLGRNRRS